ncbi:hypothetical protein GCM10010170_036260 [Dactylosporangium salmoneum]|uniref:Uncharacterized protein n=1 Tax=Dactylosporangium salmoneum TaxID=53361 RepID=A0ABN3GBG1_9ACTN
MLALRLGLDEARELRVGLGEGGQCGDVHALPPGRCRSGTQARGAGDSWELPGGRFHLDVRQSQMTRPIVVDPAPGEAAGYGTRRYAPSLAAVAIEA